MKKLASGIAMVVLFFGTFVFTAPASAAETCEEVVVTAAWTETVPAVTEEIFHEGVWEQVEVAPAMPEVLPTYEIEYEFVHKNPNHPNSPRWESEGWNAESNPKSVGWTATGNTRQGEMLTPGSPAVEAIWNERQVSAPWVETVVISEEKTIEHAAVTETRCEEVAVVNDIPTAPVEMPTGEPEEVVAVSDIPTAPVEMPTGEPEAASYDGTMLAETGMEDYWPILAVALGAILLGLGFAFGPRLLRK